MNIFEYVTNPRTGTVHLVPQLPRGAGVAFTLCGRDPISPVPMIQGDETASGIAATCGACLRLIGR